MAKNADVQMNLWGDFIKAAEENLSYVALSDGKSHTICFDEKIPHLDTGSFGKDEMTIRVSEYGTPKILTISTPLARSLKKSLGAKIRDMNKNIVTIKRIGKGYSTYYETEFVAHEEYLVE